MKNNVIRRFDQPVPRLIVKRKPKPKLLSMTEAARQLRTQTQNVSILIEAGYIQTLKLGSVGIPETEVDRFINENLGRDLSGVLDEGRAKLAERRDG